MATYNLGKIKGGFIPLYFYADLAALKAAVTAPSVGDMYGVGSAAPYTYYVYNGSDWVNQGTFQGEQGADGEPGANGKDGISPSAAVTKTGKVSTLTVIDGSGTTLVEINDGADGAPGKDGAAGAAGADGFSPTVTVTKSGKVATITATDKNGTTIAEIRDGADGSGTGDMSKATYDADDDGVVDDAAKLGGQAPDYYAKAADIDNKQDALVSGTNIKTINNKPLLGAGDLEIKLSDLPDDSTHRLVTDAEKEAWGNKLDSESDPTVPNWAKAETKPAYTASEVGAIPTSDKGAAGGVASLGTDGKVPKSQLPAIGTGDMTAAVYDPAGGAKQVAFADELSGKQSKITASGILKGNGSGGISAAGAGTDYVAPSTLSGYIPASQKGVATGVATLDSDSKVAAEQASSKLVAVTDSKTLTSSDFGTMQEVTATTAITITLPTSDNTVIGAEAEILLNASSGEVTITPPTGVTLNGASGSKVISEAYGIAVLKCVGNSEWIIKGDIS